MPASFDGKLVVAISSRALFDQEESNRVFEEQGVNAYYRYQLEHENEVLAPGIAFALVRKLLRLNAFRRNGVTLAQYVPWANQEAIAARQADHLSRHD